MFHYITPLPPFPYFSILVLKGVDTVDFRYSLFLLILFRLVLVFAETSYLGMMGWKMAMRRSACDS